MSCNSAIHVATQTPVEITTTAGTWVQVPLGSAVRRFGPFLRADGGNVLCFGPGYFDTKCSVEFTPTAAGPINFQLRQDNVAIQGMTMGITGVAATTDTITLVGMPRNCGQDCNSALTLWVDNSCTVEAVSAVVEKE